MVYDLCVSFNVWNIEMLRVYNGTITNITTGNPWDVNGISMECHRILLGFNWICMASEWYVMDISGEYMRLS